MMKKYFAAIGLPGHPGRSEGRAKLEIWAAE
jgi:hypothetical protein